VAAEDQSYVALRNKAAAIVVVLTRGEPERGGSLDHLAFAVPDGPSLRAWASVLAGSGIAEGEVVDELGKPSLTLRDPDGNRVELVAPPGSW
jgi:catechol-2,3-dioxygenase